MGPAKRTFVCPTEPYVRYYCNCFMGCIDFLADILVGCFPGEGRVEEGPRYLSGADSLRESVFEGLESEKRMVM